VDDTEEEDEDEVPLTTSTPSFGITTGVVSASSGVEEEAFACLSFFFRELLVFSGIMSTGFVSVALSGVFASLFLLLFFFVDVGGGGDDGGGGALVSVSVIVFFFTFSPKDFTC